MTELPAILYPVTYPKRYVLNHLSRLFDEVHLLLPSEKDSPMSAVAGDNTHFPSVVTHVPIPLGERLEWFRSMLRDWQQWASQIGLGREGTDAAVMEAASYAMEESLQSIVSSIRGAEQEDEDLKARIFLELALELDMREDELSSDLHEVLSEEEKLKDLLAGPAGFTRPRPGGNVDSLAPLPQGRKRLRAWARLYARWNDAPDLCPVGEGINIKDEIDQAYESLTRQPAVEILSLDLSLPSGETSRDYQKARPVMMELIRKIQAVCPSEGNGDIEELCQQVRAVRGSSEEILGPRFVLTAYPGFKWKDLLQVAARMESSAKMSEGVCGYSFYLV